MGKKCSQAISIGLVQWQHICEVGWWWLCGLVAVPPTARHTCITDMATQKFKKIGHNFALQNRHVKHITQVIVGVHGAMGKGVGVV